MPNQYPTRDIRNLGLAEGSPSAFLDLSRQQSSGVGDIASKVTNLLRQYQLRAQQNLSQTQSEQARRSAATPSELIGASPQVQRSVRASAAGALEPTLGGIQETQRFLSQQLDVIKDIQKEERERLKEERDQQRLFREPPKTLSTDRGIFQWNPDTRKWEATGLRKSITNGGTTKGGTLSIAEAQNLGLPLSLVGRGEADVMTEINSDTPSSWFRQMAQQKARASLTESALRELWKQFQTQFSTISSASTPSGIVNPFD